jgi:hypothetical protein
MLMFFPVNGQAQAVAHPSQFDPRAIGVSLHIDFGNETTTIFEDVVGSNVLEVTEAVAVVQADWTGDLAFVYSINGVSSKQETGLWWQYWVNGEFASVAANHYDVQDNDTIVWRFIDSQVEPPTSTEPTDPGLFGSLAIGSLGLGALGIVFLFVLYLMTKRN